MAGEGLAVGGGLLSLVGGFVQAQGYLDAGKAAEGAGQFNAFQYEQAAKLDQEKGAEDARRISVQGDLLRKEQEAGYSVSGVDFKEGSPLLVMATSAREVELARLQAIHAGTVNATQNRDRAAASIWQGKVARSQSETAAVASVIGGFAGAARAGAGFMTA